MVIPVNWGYGYARRVARPRAKEKEQQVLLAATTLFAERGYQAVTVADVAARAGVGLSTLYLRFPSKEALGNAVLRHCKQTWASATIDDLPAEASPQEQFAAYWTRLQAYARTRPDEAAYAQRRPVPHELDAETRTLMAELGQRSAAILRRWLPADGLDVEVASALIHGTFWDIHSQPMVPRRRSALMRQAGQAVWHALATTRSR
jgi:AcrR family transcriptional regulator